MPMATVQPAGPADDSLRQARRLRATLSDRPGELQAALRVLAGRSDDGHPPSAAAARVVAVRSRPIDPPADHLPGLSTVERAFDARVAERLAAVKVVTYSDRVALLKLGERLGVSRFRANLIVALRQHAIGAMPSPEPASGGRPSWAWVAAVAVLVEVVAVAVLWLRR